MEIKARKLWWRIFWFLIDTIAPPEPLIKEIESMSPEAFILKAMAGERLPDSPEALHFLPYRSEEAKAAVIEIKTHENRRMARLLGALLYDFLLLEASEMKLFEDFDRPLVFPIPITRKKKRERGWNQCELLGDAMRRFDKGKVFEIRTDILVKSRENADQVGRGRKERFENLRDCFSVRKKEILKDRNVIIFDDIVTTGATLSEAKRVILASGAKKVLCVALAH